MKERVEYRVKLGMGSVRSGRKVESMSVMPGVQKRKTLGNKETGSVSGVTVQEQGQQSTPRAQGPIRRHLLHLGAERVICPDIEPPVRQ